VCASAIFHCDSVVAGGADLKTAQDLARHSTPSLTMNTYAKRFRGTDRAAITSLPDLTATQSETVIATGTAGPVSR